MTRFVEISAEGVAGVRADLVATRDGLEALGPLRWRASSLGVPTSGFDEALGIADRLNADVLPVVDTHLARARDLANLRYGGVLGPPIPVVDDDPDPVVTTPSYLQYPLSSGGTQMTWAAAPAEEQEADKADEEKSKGIGGWFSDRWDDVTDAVDEGTDWVASTATSAWDAMTDIGAEIGDWWQSTTADLGSWIDENLAGVRKWIGEHVGIFRFLASAFRVVGWVLVAVGVVLTVVLAILGGLVGFGAGTLLGGVGGIPAGAAGALAGAAFGLKVLGAGFTLVSIGDFLDVVADWGEGKIDGQELVQKGALELGLAITSLIGVGVVGKILQKTFKHLPASWQKKLEDLFRREDEVGTPTTPGGRTWTGSGTIDDPVRYEYANPATAFASRAQPTPAELAVLKHYDEYPPGTEEHMLARWADYQARGKSWSWTRWRNQYILNQGQKAQGDAFEDVVFEMRGYSPDDYTRNVNVKGTTGVDRNYDIADLRNQTAVEVKSGNTIDPRQLAKDEVLMDAGWEVRYVFGSQPDAATMQKLEDAGIEWDVIHSNATVR